jgi:hypothetical protein
MFRIGALVSLGTAAAAGLTACAESGGSFGCIGSTDARGDADSTGSHDGLQDPRRRLSVARASERSSA